MPDDRTMEQLMSLLTGLFDDLDQIGRSAVAKYQDYPPEFRIDHDNRAAAACIYSHMAIDADRRLLDRPNVKGVDVRGLKVWLIGDEIALRFKKMNSGGQYPSVSDRASDQLRRAATSSRHPGTGHALGRWIPIGRDRDQREAHPGRASYPEGADLVVRRDRP